MHFILASAVPDSPFEWFSQHIQLVGWSTVLLGVYKITTFVTELKGKIKITETKLDELHKAVTNDMAHDMKRLVELAEQQNRRWEAWMTSKAASSEGHHEGHVVPVVYAAAPADTRDTEV